LTKNIEEAATIIVDADDRIDAFVKDMVAIENKAVERTL
jgi:hypothetical protein